VNAAVNNHKRTAIYSKLRELDPSPDTELHYKNPFELLVAVILSAQATDISVNKATTENIIKTCRLLIDNHDSEVPRTRDELEALPGVGRKTANVILNTAFGEPTIAVDTHIFRVSNRTGIAKGKTPLEVEKRLVRLTPDEFKKDAHHWLILHGRYICKARKPLCGECPIIEWCEFSKKELP